MNKIKVYVDRHFPYEIKGFNSPKIQSRKIGLSSSLPSFMQRVFHVADLYAKSFDADVILGNRRTTLMLGLLYHIYKPKRVSLLGYEIIFNLKYSMRHKAVILMWRLALKKIDKLIVMSGSERDYLARVFHARPQQLKTIPFYSEEASFIGPNPEGYIFAAGRMERDFITLLHALQQNRLKAIIVADKAQQELLEPLKPANVDIYYNIPKQEYLKLLEGARMVVVPLFKGAASRGQVVILEAMKYGKPVVCSKVAGTIDYIEDEQTGLLVEPENSSQLRGVLERHYHNTDSLQKLGKQAFEAHRRLFTPTQFHKKYQETIQELYDSKNKYPRVSLTVPVNPETTISQ